MNKVSVAAASTDVDLCICISFPADGVEYGGVYEWRYKSEPTSVP